MPVTSARWSRVWHAHRALAAPGRLRRSATPHSGRQTDGKRMANREWGVVNREKRKEEREEKRRGMGTREHGNRGSGTLLSLLAVRPSGLFDIVKNVTPLVGGGIGT